MILFAYAGNMDIRKFSKNVPSAKKFGIAKLPGFVFIFNLTADDESSKANIVQSFEPAAEVWGVLIKIDDSERLNFFNSDPSTNNLTLEPVNCITEDGNMYQAEAFMAKPHAINTHLLPYDWYVQKTMKIATEAGLPEAYINQFSATASKTDPDIERAAKRTKKFSL